MVKRGAVFLTCLCVCSIALAQQPLFPGKPADGTFYLDKVGVLEQEDAVEINELGTQILQDKKFPVIVVVIQSLKIMQAEHLTIEQYSRMLFDEWRIGSQENNKGILFLVSTADRKARIELGADWGKMVDHETDAVMNNRIVPQFKKGDYSEGLVDGTRGLRDIAYRLDTYATPKHAAQSSSSFDGGYYPDNTYSTDNVSNGLAIFLFIAAIITVIIIASNLDGMTNRGYRRRRSFWQNNDYLWNDDDDDYSGWSGWGGGGGFGGGGGGSFGGGSSGGGGSTGSW